MAIETELLICEIVPSDKLVLTFIEEPDDDLMLASAFMRLEVVESKNAEFPDISLWFELIVSDGVINVPDFFMVLESEE